MVLGVLNLFFKEKQKQQFQKYLGNFTALQPDDQNSFDLFESCWSSKIPNIDNTGKFDGFADERIGWLLDELGDIKGQSVLELGPLEGGHTFLLENAGAEVTSIEGNYGAFLRCLTVKNLLGLNAKFILGNFSKLKCTNDRYNIVVACGVLYHMADPVSLLRDLAKKTDNIFIWTHYFEEDLDKWSPLVRRQLRRGKWDRKNIKYQNIEGLEVRTVRQNYGKALGWRGFCGGTEKFSYWIYKDDLLSLLKSLGFINIRINFDKVDHQNGPCFALLASKFDTTYYLNSEINPDLHEAFFDFSADEKEFKAIEHFNVYGRKEGRFSVPGVASKLSEN
jgi:hypothetical protein